MVPGGQYAELSAPVPAAARRYLVTVLVGQAGGRLRVHRLRMEAAAINGGWRGNGTPDVLGLDRLGARLIAGGGGPGRVAVAPG